MAKATFTTITHTPVPVATTLGALQQALWFALSTKKITAFLLGVAIAS